MQILILGDSHTIALDKGSKLLVNSGRIPADTEIKAAYLYPGYKVGSEFYWKDENAIRFKGLKLKNKLKEVLGSKQITATHKDIVFAFSSGFYHRGLIETMLREKLLPWDLMPEVKGVRRISSQEMHNLVLGFNKYLFKFFQDLQGFGIKFFLVAPPPPRADDRIGLIRPAQQGHIQIDPICRAIVKTWYDQNNIEYVTPPSETFRNGVLSEQYHETENNDDHHGNSNYGALMIERIISKAAELSRA